MATPNYDQYTPYCDQRYGEYGKFSMSWNYGGSSSTRLKDWLDPDNTSATVLDGMEDGMLPEGELPASATWSGSHTLTGDITVPANVTLTIESGMTLNLNTHSIISTGGTITKEGGATINGLRAKLKNGYTGVYEGYCGTIQAAINAADIGDEVYIEDGPFTENLSISGKTALYIYYGAINGSITATNCNGLSINGTECKSITLNYCTWPVFTNVHMLGNGSGTGLTLYNTGYNHPGDLESIVAYNFTTGMFAYSSYCSISSEYTWFFDNSNAVMSIYNSNISLSHNNLCEITGYHLMATVNGVLSAGSCTFDNGTPSIYQSGGGNVFYSNPFACNLNKRGNIAGNPENETIHYPEEDEFGKINNGLLDLLSQVGSDMDDKHYFDKNKFKNDFLEINNLFKNYIKDNPESTYRGAAVTTAVQCYKRIEEYEAMKEFLQELKNETGIGSYAERFMIDYYREQKDFDKAFSVADELLENEKSNINLVIDVLYAKGLILAHDLNKTEEAADCFIQIVQDYPDDPMSELAKNELGILGVKQSENKNGIIKESKELSLNSYPNPFNPVAKITYALPTDELVVLKVYDILGREVTTLVNEVKQAGTYSVSFDASNLASGIYIYTISAGNFHQTKKMLLVK